MISSRSSSSSSATAAWYDPTFVCVCVFVCLSLASVDPMEKELILPFSVCLCFHTRDLNTDFSIY